MDLFLQSWAGIFYLLNKIFFSIAETQTATLKRKLKIMGWSVYILGVPAWIIILVGNNNWIAAAIEFGGIPAMLFGLYSVVNGTPENRNYELLTSTVTYFFIALGIGYSFYEHGGISSISQGLEVGVMIGFLLGGYLLAKNSIYGWLCFILMNLSMGTLMLIQDKSVLAMQQGISLCFVVFGLVTMTQNQRIQSHA